MAKNKSKKVLKYKKSKKSRKSKKNLARGPSSEYYDKNECCMCSKNIDVEDKLNTLIPLSCLREHGAQAHRICKHCWFRPRTGFATEGRSHACPGCIKGKRKTIVRKKPTEIVDLTLSP
jgi:hypothetical protein